MIPVSFLNTIVRVEYSLRIAIHDAGNDLGFERRGGNAILCVSGPHALPKSFLIIKFYSITCALIF